MTNETTELASRWKRLAGATLDSLVALAITAPILMVTGIFELIEQGQPMSIGQRVFFFIFGISLFLIINGYLLAKHGQTVGKRLVGTRIVSSADESILPLLHVYGLRHLPLTLIAQIPIFGNLFCLLDCLFIFREDRRCIHDIIAGTKVIDV